MQSAIKGSRQAVAKVGLKVSVPFLTTRRGETPEGPTVTTKVHPLVRMPARVNRSPHFSAWWTTNSLKHIFKHPTHLESRPPFNTSPPPPTKLMNMKKSRTSLYGRHHWKKAELGEKKEKARVRTEELILSIEKILFNKKLMTF